MERDGRRLEESDAREILLQDPAAICGFGGEFFLECSGCKARDHFGIMPGDCPAGTLVCNGKVMGDVHPKYPLMDLDEAIRIAVQLRSDHGVVADEKRVVLVRNGHAMMANIVGTGCMATSVIGTFAAVEKDYVAASVAGLVCYEVAAQMAAARAEGPGSFKEMMFDAVFNLDAETVKRMQRIEV